MMNPADKFYTVALPHAQRKRSMHVVVSSTDRKVFSEREVPSALQRRGQVSGDRAYGTGDCTRTNLALRWIRL